MLPEMRRHNSILSAVGRSFEIARSSGSKWRRNRKLAQGSRAASDNDWGKPLSSASSTMKLQNELVDGDEALTKLECRSKMRMPLPSRIEFRMICLRMLRRLSDQMVFRETPSSFGLRKYWSNRTQVLLTKVAQILKIHHGFRRHPIGAFFECNYWRRCCGMLTN